MKFVVWATANDFPSRQWRDHHSHHGQTLTSKVHHLSHMTLGVYDVLLGQPQSMTQSIIEYH